jgi:hypothetical protein
MKVEGTDFQKISTTNFGKTTQKTTPKTHNPLPHKSASSSYNGKRGQKKQTTYYRGDIMNLDDDFLHDKYLKEQAEAAAYEANQIFQDTAALIPHAQDSMRVRKFDEETYKNTPVLSKLKWMVDKEAFENLETCSHVDFEHPTVWSVFVGQADFLGCQECIMQLEAAAVEYSPDECDCCGKKGVEVFYEYFANIGFIIVHGSFCKTCITEQRSGEYLT